MGNQARSDRRRPLCAAHVVLRGTVVAGLLVGMVGCRLLSRQPVVAESVAACRQFSQQGLAAMEHGEWDRAEALLVQAVRACPTNAQARCYYAETLWHRGASAESVSELETALELDADDAHAAMRLGEMLLAIGQPGRAQLRAEQALDLDPKLASAWALRGRVMRTLGETDRALADLQRALDFSPNDRQALLDIAELYRQRGRPQRALATLQHLVDAYPPGEEPAEVLFLQGLAYKALGRPQRAVESLYAARQRTPRPSADLLFHLGEAELLAGRAEAATAVLQEALAIDSQHPPSLQLWGRLRGIQQAQATVGGMTRR